MQMDLLWSGVLVGNSTAPVYNDQFDLQFEYLESVNDKCEL